MQDFEKHVAEHLHRRVVAAPSDASNSMMWAIHRQLGAAGSVDELQEIAAEELVRLLLLATA